MGYDDINRDILECKWNLGRDPEAPEYILIETYWNVNRHKRLCNRTGEVILIETYWNVNKVLHKKASRRSTILIETYWNVNNSREEWLDTQARY